MQASHERHPATLRVFRYRTDRPSLDVIIGDASMPLPEAELIKRARDAMDQSTFVVHTVVSDDEGETEELCFVPQVGRCEILSIRSNGWRRHHGDHRRSLLEILNDLAAAVALGRLRLLDAEELAAEELRGERLFSRAVYDTTTLSTARTDIAAALEELGFDKRRRDQTVLCASEAATNALVHGGGTGSISLHRLPASVRVAVRDRGPGLNFLNWLESPVHSAQASMGYGYRIILDHIDSVGLHTSATGTTLILDQSD
jgi:anti-sigma regulatory factor (Ser/Thr protein kinase)